MPVKRTIKSNCTCGRFEEITKVNLIAKEGESEDLDNIQFFPYYVHIDKGQINFCDGCGRKIWVEEEKGNFEYDEDFEVRDFPEKIYNLEAGKPIPTDEEVRLNRYAINWILEFIKDTHFMEGGSG